MGIIGVVAALTLPNLNSSTGDKEKVAKVKKIFSNLNDAVGRAQAVYGPIDEWCSGYSGSCSVRHFDRITEFLKVSKKCDKVTTCSMIIDKNGTGGTSSIFSAILADGTVMNFHTRCVASVSNCIGGSLNVDIDGLKKGANKQGYDVFKFYYDNNGVYTYDIMSNSAEYVHKDDNIQYYFSNSATAWIINFGNMDYLKTTDGTTCPNGTKLTVGGNHSCK